MYILYIYIETVAKYLQFKEYQKKPKRYIRIIDMNTSANITNTFYVHTGEENVTIVTILTKNGGEKEKEVETKNIMRRGDVLITGPKGEKYVIGAGKFLALYNVNEEVAVPRALPRMAARLTKYALRRGKVGNKGDSIVFVAPWGEEMIANVGDYIVKDGDGNGYYRVERGAFLETYKEIKKIKNI